MYRQQQISNKILSTQQQILLLDQQLFKQHEKKNLLDQLMQDLELQSDISMHSNSFTSSKSSSSMVFLQEKNHAQKQNRKQAQLSNQSSFSSEDISFQIEKIRLFQNNKLNAFKQPPQPESKQHQKQTQFTFLKPTSRHKNNKIQNESIDLIQIPETHEKPKNIPINYIKKQQNRNQQQMKRKLQIQQKLKNQKLFNEEIQKQKLKKQKQFERIKLKEKQYEQKMIEQKKRIRQELINQRKIRQEIQKNQIMNNQGNISELESRHRKRIFSHQRSQNPCKIFLDSYEQKYRKTFLYQKQNNINYGNLSSTLKLSNLLKYEDMNLKTTKKILNYSHYINKNINKLDETARKIKHFSNSLHKK